MERVDVENVMVVLGQVAFGTGVFVAVALWREIPLSYDTAWLLMAAGVAVVIAGSWMNGKGAAP